MVPPSFVPNFGIKPRTCQSARRSGLRPRRPRPIRAAGRSYAPDCPRTHGWPCKSTDHPYNVQMMKFDWDPAKAASNLRKHGVSFERSEEHTSELQSLMRISYAVFCLKKKTKQESV